MKHDEFERLMQYRNSFKSIRLHYINFFIDEQNSRNCIEIMWRAFIHRTNPKFSEEKQIAQQLTHFIIYYSELSK
jgi:hypothetical protein